jgi:hypothetical protein
MDGVDVSTSDAADQSWWTGTGFSGADWTNVWEWGTNQPKLR